MKYQIIPIKSEFLDKVRVEGLDDQNQAVEIITASGGEPCRDVFRRAKAGEKLILASYCPFNVSGPYKEYGPIFVLANASNEATQDLTLSNLNDDKVGYFSGPFVLKAYSKDERILDAKLTCLEEAEADLVDYLSHERVAFVIARYAAFGCFSLRAELCR